MKTDMSLWPSDLYRSMQFDTLFSRARVNRPEFVPLDLFMVAETVIFLFFFFADKKPIVIPVRTPKGMNFQIWYTTTGECGRSV